MKLSELQKLIEKEVGKSLGENDDLVSKSEYDTLKAVVDDHAQKMQARNMKVGVPGTGVDDPGKFSFCRAVLGMITKKWDTVAPYEKEVFDASRKEFARINRDASLADDETLGFLVPTQVIAEIIPLLRSMMIMEDLGVTMMDGLVGSPVEMVRETEGSTGYWVGENGPLTKSDQKTDMLRMRPHKAGAMTKLSNTLLRVGGGNGVEEFVRKSLMKQVARTVQQAFFNGVGANGQPLGVLNASNILAATAGEALGGSAGAADMTFVMLQKFIEEIESNNALIGPMAWACHPRIKHQIKQLSRNHGGSGASTDPLFLPGRPTEGIPDTVLGYPIYSTTDIPLTASGAEGDLILAPWETTILGSWGAMELATTSEAGDSFVNDQTWVRVIHEVDVAVKQPTAIRHVSRINV